MKYVILLLIILPRVIYAQTDTYVNLTFDSTYAVGEIANLSDTMRLFTNYNQIKQGQSYTKLKKVKSGNYQLSYWEIESGGIIDPILYKYNLKINLMRRNKVKLAFANKKKTYFIRAINNKEGLYYELINKINNAKQMPEPLTRYPM